MNDFASIRLGVFLAALLICALAERLLPRRARVASAGPRWFANLSLAVFGTLVMRLCVPFAAVEAAGWAQAAGFGLMNRSPVPFALKFGLSLLMLDLLIYGQHRLFHMSRALWRLHAVHHTDLDLDASSGVRFHPGEILLSALIKMTGVALLGAPVVAVVAFEVILNASSIFNHSNLNLGSLDAWARMLVVTPDMHRVHHSPALDETNSNFSFNLPWWDHLFGTYRAQPRAPHADMPLGLDGDRDEGSLGLRALLGRPFRRIP